MAKDLYDNLTLDFVDNEIRDKYRKEKMEGLFYFFIKINSCKINDFDLKVMHELVKYFYLNEYNHADFYYLKAAELGRILKTDRANIHRSLQKLCEYQLIEKKNKTYYKLLFI